jgi:hypothetical protein
MIGRPVIWRGNHACGEWLTDEDAIFVPARRIGPLGGVIRAPAPATLSVRAASGPAVKSRRDGVSVRGAAP